jgi:uncharacterized protein (TIGR02246 family)
VFHRIACIGQVTGIALALLGTLECAVAAPAGACNQPTANEQTIVALFGRWNAALAIGDPAGVAKLYADDAVLQADPSLRSRVGREAIAAYYAEFLQRHPRGAVTERVISIDCGTAADTGMFVYRVTGRRKGTRMLIGGSYALEYAYRDGDWLIVRHKLAGMIRPLSSAGDFMGQRNVKLGGTGAP